MGIKGINKFLKSKIKEDILYEQTEISYFTGLSIAIDGNNFLYKYMAIANKKCMEKLGRSTMKVNEFKIDKTLFYETYLNLLLNLCNRLSKEVITPIFVFDGNASEMKDDTKKKRLDIKKKKVDVIDSLIEDYKNEKCSKEDVLKKLQYSYSVSNKDIDMTIKFLLSLGIPAIKPNNEAEKYAVYLTKCKEHNIIGVLSTDTDLYPYGCNVIINEIINDQSLLHFKTAMIDNILLRLGITQKQLIDFCIMCGTDYNNNVKNIGPARAFELIKKYKDIDGIIKSDSRDFSSLNHIEVRKLFNFDNCEPIDTEKLKFKKIDNDDWKDVLKEFFNDEYFDKKLIRTCRMILKNIK